MNCRITVNHTSIVISDYNLGDCPELEKNLSVWNEGYFRFEPIGFMYNEKERKLYIPRGVSINYVETLLNTNSDVNYVPDPYDEVSIKLKKMPRDDVQRKSIAFLIGENDFKYTRKYSQLLLNLAPGDGKTFISVAAMTFLRMRTMVVTHMDKIKKQWYDTLINVTDLSPGYICNISGSSDIKKLLKNNNLKYKVYLVNHGTLASYAKSNGWEAVSELFKHLKIGVKIFDEAHLHFSNIIKVDLNTNTKKTIYLTATFERTNRFEARLFNICFRNLVRFGSETVNDKEKHIIYIGALYNSHPSLSTQEYMYIPRRGFNKIRYSEYLSTSQKFFDALDYVLKYFMKHEGTIMILGSKISSIEIIRDFISDNYPNRTVSLYHSKISDAEKLSALSADIICTTPQSAGTGFDLPGLRTVIMTESYSSKVEAEQVSGRLRKYSDNDKTFYIELVDTGFKRAYEMYKQRLKVFKNKCYKVTTINLKDKI